MTLPVELSILSILLLLIVFAFSGIMFIEMVRYSHIRHTGIEKKRKKNKAKPYDYLALGSIYASIVFFVFGTAFAGIYIIVTFLRML